MPYTPPPTTTVTFWQKAPFFRFLPPLVLSIICYDMLPQFHYSTPLLSIGLFGVLTSLFLLLQLYKSANRGRAVVLFVCFQLAVFTLGITICQLTDETNKPHWMGNHIEEDASYIATITETPTLRKDKLKIAVAIKGILQNKQLKPCTGKALLYVYLSAQPKSFTIGQTILLPGKWKLIPPAKDILPFDYPIYCHRNGIYHWQFSAQSQVVIIEGAQPNFISRIHNACMQRLQQHIKNSTTAALLQAMIAGDDAHFDNELRASYAQTGIVHIIAISGTHIANLFWIMTVLLFWVRNPRYKWTKYVAGFAAIWLYVLIAGAPPSALRAAIMFSVVAFGVVLRRQHQLRNNLFIAAFICLIIQPNWLFSVGFQLSFTAVLSIIIFYKPILSLAQPRQALRYTVWQAIVVSLSVEILVFPLVMYYFHNLPVVFLLTNLTAWFITTFCMAMGMLIILFAPFPTIADSLGNITGIVVGYFHQFVRLLQNCSPASFQHFHLSAVAFWLLYLFIVLLAIAFLRKRLRLILPALSVFAILMVIQVQEKREASNQRKLVISYNSGKSSIVSITGLEHLRDSMATEDYNLNSLLTAYHAWSASAERQLPKTMMIQNKKLLILDNSQVLPQEAQLPVDIVLLRGSLKAHSRERIIHTFSPKEIIICDRQHWRVIEKWADACAQKDITLQPMQREQLLLIE